MHRPDYRIQTRKKRPWLIHVVLLGLLLGLIFGGMVNGWWSLNVAAEDEVQALATVDENAASIAMMTLVTPSPPETASLSSNPPASAPDFELPDLFDESISHRLSNYTGRPVILNFWASWCVPCKTEMPALQHAYEKYRVEKLIILGLNQTFVDDLTAAREFVYELSLTFPNLRDDSGNTSEGLYQIIGIPTSVFITAEGRIAHIQIGQMTDQQIETFSQQIISSEVIGP